MSTYFNPPDAIRKVGRELLIQGSFQTLVDQLKDDEVLFGLYDRGIFKNAVHLFDPAEMEVFEKQVRSSVLIRLGYYALSRNVAKSYCNCDSLRDQIR